MKTPLLLSLVLSLSLASVAANADRISPEPKAKRGVSHHLNHIASLGQEVKTSVEEVLTDATKHLEEHGGGDAAARSALADIQSMQNEATEFVTFAGSGTRDVQMSITKLNDLYEAWTLATASYGNIGPTPSLVEQGYEVSRRMQRLLNYYRDHIIE